ncbi:hypothetical protein CLU79DRAFT_746769 [Phycomyces nitens]|nr:hypothetical protein CLU79DRAFT_746769 [Phycomyces nitens]
MENTTSSLTHTHFNGGPMPEQIRNSYTQQQLPVRNQSLAAFSHLSAQPIQNKPKDTPPSRRLSMTAWMTSSKSCRYFGTRDSPPSTDKTTPTPTPASCLCLMNTQDHFQSGLSPSSPIPTRFSISGATNPHPPDDSTTTDPMSPVVWKQLESNLVLSFTGETNHKSSCDTELSHSWNERSNSFSKLRNVFLRLNSKKQPSNQVPMATSAQISSSPPKPSLSTVYYPPKRPQIQPKQNYTDGRVYPALLSHVAREIYRRLQTGTLVKNGIVYHDVFSGKEATDCMIIILNHQNRNLALLVGRALDSQGFINEVNYEHRLRDSPGALYRFRSHHGLPVEMIDEEQRIKTKDDVLMDTKRVNGIFTVLTECYSPTCTRGFPCYSFSCPRTARKPSLRRSRSNSSIRESTNRLWRHSIPKQILDTITAKERKRQECIFELIYTEQDFVKDLKYISNCWIKPLMTSDIIPAERRERFVQQVFWNLPDIELVNDLLCKSLVNRQRKNSVVPFIGDLMLHHVSFFGPFVGYGAHQVIGKFSFELEKKRNPRFAQFVEKTERLPASRRLELNGYLTKPTARLGRYNLFFREILQCTDTANDDYVHLPKVMEIIREYLAQMNHEIGETENRFNLQQMEARLSYKSATDIAVSPKRQEITVCFLTIKQDLQLLEPERRLIIKGRMKRKNNTTSDASDIQVFLLDHYLVFAKIKYHDHLEFYKVFRKPIPLVHLSYNVPDTRRSSTYRLSYSKSSPTSTISNSSTLTSPTTPRSSAPTNDVKVKCHPITFIDLRNGTPITLYTSTDSTRNIWLEQLDECKHGKSITLEEQET